MRWILLFLSLALGCQAATNRIPNSSFEVSSGRGWVHWHSGNSAFLGNTGTTIELLTNNAFHGASGIRIPTGARLLGRAVWLTNGAYTFTMYARTASGTQGPFKYGMVAWGDLDIDPPGSVNITASWARYTNQFVVTSNALYWPKFFHNQPTIMVDAVQLEEGTTATPYVPQATVEAGLSIPATNSLWFAGDSPIVRLNFRNEGAAVTSRVAYAVYDLWNSNVLSSTISASLAALTNGTTDISMPARKGWFRITSRILDTDDSYDEATTIIYPYAYNIATTTNDWLGGHPHSSPFHVRRELLTARKWARNLSPNYGGSRWTSVEPTRGNFVWSDYAFTNWFNDGIQILTTLTPSIDATWNSWATNADGTADLMAWSNYCYQVVARYKNYCTHWEVGPNEPYQSGALSPIVVTNATNYAILLSYGVAAVTNADPTAKIVGMAGAFGDGTWAMQVWTNLTLATQTNITYLSTHNYGDLSGDPNAAYAADAKFSNAKGWMERFGSIRPVWNTESGAYGTGPIKGMNGMWPIAYSLYSVPAVEASRAVRMNRQLTSTAIILPEALRSIGYGFQKYFYYDSRYFNEGSFATVEPYPADYLQVDRPEVATLSVATHFITKGFGKITNAIGPALEMYSYTNSVGQAVVSAWNYDRTNRTLTLSSSAYALYDCMGNLLQTNVAAAKINRFPHYFVSGSHTAVALSNIMATASVVVSTDVTPPQISMDIAPSGTWTGGDALFKWTALDDTWTAWTTAGTATNVLYKWKLNNEAYNTYSQTNHVWLTNLVAGNHTLWVSAMDAAQNTNEISYTFSPQVAASGNTATDSSFEYIIVVPPP
jgi:hypothetical protein